MYWRTTRLASLHRRRGRLVPRHPCPHHQVTRALESQSRRRSTTAAATSRTTTTSPRRRFHGPYLRAHQHRQIKTTLRRTTETTRHRQLPSNVVTASSHVPVLSGQQYQQTRCRAGTRSTCRQVSDHDRCPHDSASLHPHTAPCPATTATRRRVSLEHQHRHCLLQKHRRGDDPLVRHYPTPSQRGQCSPTATCSLPR